MEEKIDLGTRNRYYSKISTSKILKLLVLHILMKRQYYGSEISEEITNITNGIWRPNNGLLYPVLHDMEENKWISGQWNEPDRKNKCRYIITDEGIRHYNKVKLIYRHLLEESLAINRNVLEEVYKAT